MTIATFWPIVPLVLGSLCVHAIGLKLTESRIVALVMTIAWAGAAPAMGYQTSAFAATLMVPLCVLVLVRDDGTAKSRIVLGFVFALTALSYLVAFFGLGVLLFGLFVHRALGRPRLARHDGRLRVVREPGRASQEIKAWLPFAAVAVPIVLILWGPLIVAYGGHVVNPSHFYGDQARGWTAPKALSVLGSVFFDVSSFARFALSIGASIGVFAAWRQRHTHGGKWALLVLIVGLAGSFHYLVTMPLLDNHLVYYRFPLVFLRLAQVLLIGQAIVFVARDVHRDALRPGVAMVALVIVATATIPLTPAARSAYDASAQVHDGGTDAIKETSAWARAHIPDDAVVLALDHESFVFNGLTGKKVVFERRTHANPFVDMDKRYAEAAVMMYGKNRENATRLMDAYGVTHAYVGWYYEGNLADYPWVTSRDYAAYWRDNGIPFEETVAPYDPMGDAQLFPVIRFLTPKNETMPFLADFTAVHETAFDGRPWMTIYQRNQALS